MPESGRVGDRVRRTARFTTRVAGLAGLLAFALPLASGRVLAQVANEPLREAIRDYALGKYEKSIDALTELLNRGTDRRASTIAMANRYLAAAHVALGNIQAAREAIVAAVKIEPTTDFDPRRFPQALVRLFFDVRKSVLGKLRVQCGRDDAVVEVVGHASGRCGHEFTLPVGHHVVRVTVGSRKPEVREAIVFFSNATLTEVALPMRLGTLTVRVNPASARVFLDGAEIAARPVDRHPVEPGPHVVAVRAEGFKDDARSITVESGKDVSVAVVLAPTANEPRDIGVVTGPVASPAKRPSNARKVLGWVLIGTGAATVLAGAGSHVYVHNVKVKIDGSRYSGSYSVDDIESLQRTERVANVLLGVGGAMAVAGAILAALRSGPATPVAGGVTGVLQTIGVGSRCTTLSGAGVVGVQGRWEF